MKMLVDLGIFNPVISFKVYGLIVIAKIVFLNKQTNICWFKYELRGFYNFILRNIIYAENKWKTCFSQKIRNFCSARTVANQEKV